MWWLGTRHGDCQSEPTVMFGVTSEFVYLISLYVAICHWPILVHISPLYIKLVNEGGQFWNLSAFAAWRCRVFLILQSASEAKSTFGPLKVLV